MTRAKSNARSYHHGGVRSAALAAGHSLLAERSAEGVSLREIARVVGVSQTAIYHHFPDKAALMSALAADGMEELALVQQAANDAAGGGRHGFMAMGVAYVEFAIRAPALFRLIYSYPPDHDPLDREWGGVSTAMAQLLDVAPSVAPPGADIRAFALHIWGLVHGLAMLVLDGQIPAEPAGIRAALGVYFTVTPPDA